MTSIRKKVSVLDPATSIAATDKFHVAQSGASTSATRSFLLGSLYDIRHYGAAVDGSTDDTSKIQDAIDAANTAGGGFVVIPATGSNCIVASEVTLKESVTLMLATGAVIEHTASSGTCITVTKNSHVIGGTIVHTGGAGYTGTLIGTDNSAFPRDEPSVRIHTMLKSLNNHVGTGLHIEADGNDQDAHKQWMDVDIVCATLGTGLHLEVKNQGVGGTAFINGNTIKASFTGCDQPVYLEGENTSSGKIAENAFFLRIQASSNTTELIKMEACINNQFYMQVFDWDPASAEGDGGINRYSGDQGNFRNAFFGSLDYRYFHAQPGNSAFYGDIGLGGAFNYLVHSYQSSSPMRLDSSVADTDQKYVPSRKQEGMFWYDNNGDTLKYYDGAIKTITAT